MTRALAVRARLVPGPDARFQRLYDPILDALAHDGPLARERFETRWSDTAALTALAAAKRGPLPPALTAELTEYHRRLGASPASLAALDRLGRGEAVCAIAGQQPAPLGGPLYSLHKVADAAGLARSAEERTGIPCVPMFWMHGEDSDFDEIRDAVVSDATLALRELTLPASAHVEGGLLGNLPLEPLAALDAEALAAWTTHPAHADVEAVLARSTARARDLGEAHSALMLALFADSGLVVVDPRLPAFRAAAREIVDRYLAKADAMAAAARAAGDRLESAIGRRPLDGRALESFVFAIEDGRRHKITPVEARQGGAALTLSPSVALRPVVQDGVFPTVAMACGPGEAAYLAQLREVFAGLAVRAASPVPRFGATWLPPAAVSLIEETGADPWEVIHATDVVLRHHAEQQVPAETRAALDRARREANDGLADFAEASRRVDQSLPQMVESARGKVDYQFARLEEGLIAKVRHRIERQHPEWLRVRYFLLPGDRLQERRLASLEVVAWRGMGTGAEVSELAADHARRLAAGVLEHLVLEL